jgi:hypothetical protein
LRGERRIDGRASGERRPLDDFRFTHVRSPTTGGDA